MDFSKLSVEEQIGVLMRKGYFVIMRDVFDHEEWLYTMDGEFVEVIYSKPFQRIEEVVSTTDIDKYLPGIDITEMLN